MIPDGRLRIEDVWNNPYDLAGNYLGVVEAVAFRHGKVRRVGVPRRDSERRGIKFYCIEGAWLEAGRIVFPADEPARS